MKKLAIGLLLAAGLGAQTITTGADPRVPRVSINPSAPIPSGPGGVAATITPGGGRTHSRGSVTAGMDLRFFLAEEVFPHVAIGGVWSSEITFVNIDGGIAVFPLTFYRPDGSLWPVTIPGFGTTALWEITVNPGRIMTLPLQSPGANTETGWAVIEQPSGATVGGHVIFADRTPGRPLFEAVVPLSLYWENEFFMPFDNTGGNSTCIAWVNSSEFSSSNLFVEFLAYGGASIHLASRSLAASRQQSFCLAGEYPQTANQRGVMKVVGTGFSLSALGFRFNPGGAFTTLFPMSR